MAPTPACRIKICGITRTEDAICACSLGAWALGFIFFPKSPRYVTPQKTREIIQELESRSIAPKRTVGVFVNPTAEMITQTVQSSGINTIQLHGEEPLDFCRRLPLPCIKALRLNGEDSLTAARSYAKAVDYLLIDAYHPETYGGSGTLADWSLAATLREEGRLILAGGITPDNIREAIASVAPHAIDLSSGVETAPGIKSHALLARLFSEAG